MPTIDNMKDLCDHFGADEPAGLNRQIYKDTDCGASISVCVRNPHNTRPHRIEMVVRHSTYKKAKYPYASPVIECWVDDDQHPLDGHIISVTRNGQKVEDPEELAAYAKAFRLDDPAFFWGSIEFLPKEKTAVAGDGSRHGWTVVFQPGHDPLLIDLPCLEIESLAVGDRQIPRYLGDHLRESYRDCQWFEQWENRVLSGLHFSCGDDRAEFWPQDPQEVRRGSPRTLDDLKASATRFIEYDGRTKLVWDLQHDEAPDLVVASVLVRRRGEGSTITAVGHGDDNWIPDPKMNPQAWMNTYADEAWFDKVVQFFGLDTDLAGVSLEQMRSQNWEDRDEVQVDPDPNDPDEIQITKTFRSTDRCWGWKSGQASQWVWVHNGNSLWRDLTIDTPIRAFTIQSIVEGSDATVDSDQFNVPCPTEKVDQWMEEMEEQTSAIWDRDNHNWYYVRREGEPVGQVKTGGFGPPVYEAWDPERSLSEKEQQVLIRWLDRGGADGEDDEAGLPFTRLTVERFYPEVW